MAAPPLGESTCCKSRTKLVTTEAVLWEWMNGLASSTTRVAAIEGYRRCHLDSRIEVIPFAAELIASAVRLYENRTDKDWSLTDCLSFVVLERRGISSALTTDHYFEQSGAKALLLSDPPE
jgi:predicted nucleic acid-binding protein